jgi:hypothetical protein
VLSVGQVRKNVLDRAAQYSGPALTSTKTENNGFSPLDTAGGSNDNNL